MSSSEQAGDESLPLVKIRTIMRCSPDIEHVANDSLTLVGKATELFIQHFITQAYVHSRDRKTIHYNDLVQAVDSETNLNFLADVLPRKRLASECVDFRKLNAKKSAATNS